MKKCNKCEKEKQLSEFFRDKNNKTDGHYSICKSCKTESSLKWRAENRESYNRSQRLQHARNYERNRLYRYDITEEQYNKMLTDQSHKCAIPGCNKTATLKRKLAIDHDHVTKEVRGLLCYKCNRDMNVVDDKEHLAKLISYRDKKHD